MKPTSRLSCRSCTKSIGKDVSRMTRSLAYIGVVVLVVGVLLTTCVGSAWSIEVLTDEQLAAVHGSTCPNVKCADTAQDCYTGKFCVNQSTGPPPMCATFSYSVKDRACVEPKPDWECWMIDPRYDCVSVQGECECYTDGEDWYCGQCEGTAYRAGDRDDCTEDPM